MPRRPKTEHSKQPRVLCLACITAMCERFGYYIIGFLLTLIAKNVYKFSDDQAFALFAVFTALGYLTPAIGGYLADKLVGIKRCLALGLALEGMGYVLLAIPTTNTMVFHIALGAIIVGAGIFKTAPTNLLGRAYDDNDPRIDSGFTLYYMGINIGSLGSSLVAGSMQSAYGWHMPFVFAAVGLFIGVVWFVFFKHHAKGLSSPPGKKLFTLMRWAAVLGGMIAAVALFAYLMSDTHIANICFYIGSTAVLIVIAYETFIGPREEIVRIGVCMALIVMAIVFFLLYFQLYTSMELFISRNVDRFVGSYEIPTVYFLGLNGLWIITLSPLYAWLYKFLQRDDRDLSITTKFPMGILLIGLCFVVLNLACAHFSDHLGRISPWWMVLSLFFYSAGELLTSALGVAMITRIAPPRMYGIMMGSWYLIATALAADLSGQVAKLASIPAKLQHDVHASLGIYGSAFGKMAMIGILAAVIGFLVSPLLKRAAKI